MLTKIPLVFNFNGSFIFEKSICRCFNNFILPRFYETTKQHFLTHSFQGTVFNYSKTTSAMKSNNFSDRTIKLSDYDCIGFDLDNTLCEYNLKPLIQMEYKSLISYLCDFKGYPREVFIESLEESNMDFLQRGLMLDLKKGNILKISSNGTILKACHGTKEMSDTEITGTYGKDKRWEVTNAFCNDMISTWNGPLADELRSLLDYFDISASLAFAQAVDYNDRNSDRLSGIPKAGEDIRSALLHTFKRDHFQSEESLFFREMKTNQHRYTLKCPSSVIDWLKKLKETNKVTFLLTGSNIDFASFTAEFSLGENWRELFDVVVCFAKKPGFFVNNSPFIGLDGFNETAVIDREDLTRGSIYSQGNWKDLIFLLSKLTGKVSPKCIYFGDNVVQDVYAPMKFCGCDTIAVIDELKCDSLSWPKSDKWGSYFKLKQSPGSYTIWESAIQKYSRICIPSMKYIAEIPLDTEFRTFCDRDDGKIAGFHPEVPDCLREVHQMK